MLKCERTSVMNFENAIRGARNPMNSWDKSDTETEEVLFIPERDSDGNDISYEKTVKLDVPKIGPTDLNLLQRLVRSGSDHRKFLRQIFVSVDITAPLFFWKEFDTYKIGTVANSCSTMHKIHAKPFERDDFSHDRLDEGGLAMLDTIIAYLEAERQKFVADKENRQPWHNMIQILPTSYNQMRTVTLNYETLINMYYARRNHKLAEWHTLCSWIESLPYARELICYRSENGEN